MQFRVPQTAELGSKRKGETEPSETVYPSLSFDAVFPDISFLFGRTLEV